MVGTEVPRMIIVYNAAIPEIKQALWHAGQFACLPP
eukprot:COSAG01_NODE_572_length_15298_cov_8.549172_3_plen_36_part_00